MSDFYKAYQALFALVGRHNAAMAAVAAPPDRVAALTALRDRLGDVADALEQALADLQNAGGTNHALMRALQIANLCHSGATQLLVRAIDGSEAIRASAEAMDARIEELDRFKQETADLTDDLGRVTTVLTAAGKALELIKP